MTQTEQLSHLELLDVLDGDGVYRGGDREWLSLPDRVSTGQCPAACALLFSYLSQTRPDCKPLYPSQSWDKADFLALMESLWTLLAPEKEEWPYHLTLLDKLTAYGESRGVTLSFRELDIPKLKLARPTADQCIAFLRSGLRAESPVLWQSHHPGALTGLSGRRWLPIVAVELDPNGPVWCTYYAGGKSHKADFRLWFQSTKQGGALLYAAHP